MNEEEMEHFVEVEDSEDEEGYKLSEIDFEYEFDAAHFFDFSRSETISEVLEAEHWFHVSGNYPSSRKNFLKISPPPLSPSLCEYVCL